MSVVARDTLPLRRVLGDEMAGVFAAGDVAEVDHPRYGVPVRVEHWANALNTGPVAARAMLGQDVSHDETPYLFTDRYDLVAAGMNVDVRDVSDPIRALIGTRADRARLTDPDVPLQERAR